MRWIAALLLASTATLLAQSVFIHKLTWQSQGDLTSGYKIYKSFNGSPFSLLAGTTNLTISFTNNQPGYYRYRVTAYNQYGESLPSNEVAIDMGTQGKAPRTPTNLVLTVLFP